MNTRSKKYFPVKPARSYEEQLTRLSEIHDLTIGDPDRARYILSTVNYYRLTTYGKHLRRADDPEKFQPGVTLETLFGLYQFDMNLRHLLLPVLEFFGGAAARQNRLSAGDYVWFSGVYGRRKLSGGNAGQRFVCP